jgi:hypothetical protein
VPHESILDSNLSFMPPVVYVAETRYALDKDAL